MAGATEPLAFPHQRQATAPPDAVFFVGDSITLGWRDEDLGGWPVRLIGALAAKRAVTSYNLGVRGDTSEEIRVRWQDEVDRRRRAATSAAIVFAFGANDAKVHPGGEPFVPLEATRRNTASILGRARHEDRVLFVGPAPVEESTLAEMINPNGDAAVPNNRQVAAVSEILASEAARAGVPYFDLLGRLRDNDAWFDSLRETDGIHPPGRGHDLIAALIGAWDPWNSLFASGEGR